MQLISRTLLLLLLGIGAGFAAACDDTTTTSTTSPTPTTTETFTGTVTVNGAVTHVFATTQRGSVSATLTAAGTDNTATLGVSLGTWNGTSCQTILANDQAVVGAGVLG